MRGPGSIPTGGNFLSLDLLHIVKPLMPILPLLPILSICEKSEYASRTVRAKIMAADHTRVKAVVFVMLYKARCS